MIKIYAGRAATGKTYKVLSEIKDKFNKNINEKLILIVPEQYTLQAEMDLLKTMEIEGIINFQVLSFNRLIQNVIGDMGGIKSTEINHLGKTMILKKIFDAEKDNLEVYGKAYKKIGFIREMGETISELKRAEISTDKFLNALKLVNEETLGAKKFNDIGLIYSQYENNMKDKFSDDEDKIDYGCQKILEWEIVRDAEIWIDGFSGFTEQEYKIINNLFLVSKDITITLTVDNEGEIFKNSKRTLNRLKEISESLDKKFVVEKFFKSHKTLEINHLEKNLFLYPFDVYENSLSNIEIIQARNMNDEIEKIAYEILNLVINKDYMWKDIGLITSDIENYIGNIERIFSTYKIPYFLDSKIVVMNNSLIRFILLSLECLINGFKQESMIELLKTEYFGIKNQELNRLENYILKRGIKGKKWFLNIGESTDENFNEYYLGKFVFYIKELNKSFKKANQVEDYVKGLFKYMENLNIFHRHEEFIDTLKEKKLFDKVIENTQIWNKIIEVINQLVEISGSDFITTKDFFSLIESGFSEISLGIIPQNNDVITIGNYSRSKSGEAKILFLIGANDGFLPKINEEYGLLMDEDKKLLENLGFEIKSSIDFRNTEEEYSIYQTISKASEKLIFTYSKFNLEGKSINPSVYIERLKKIFPLINEKNSEYFNKYSMNFLYGGKQEILKRAAFLTRKLMEGKDLKENELQFLSFLKFNNKFQYNNILDYLLYTNIPEKLSSKYTEKLYNIPIVTSVSKIEKYINCPFSYFVKYGLRPKKRQYYRVEMPDIGIIFHNSLELFGKRTFAMNINWKDIDRQLSDKIVDEIVDELINNYYDELFLSTNSNKYLINKIKRVVKRSVWVATNQLKSGSFDPKAFEIEFSNSIKEDTVPPIIIDSTSGERIFLEGRIDRIDLVDINGKKYIKIIDYKSSQKKYSLSDVFNGLQMQLLIYMDATIQNSKYFREDKLYPGGAFYFRIDDPIIETTSKDNKKIETEISKLLKLEGIAIENMDIVEAIDKDILLNNGSDIISVKLNKEGEFNKDSSLISQENFNNLIDHIKVKISNVGQSIINGDVNVFPVKNGDRTACDYCEYRNICQFDEKILGNYYNRVKKYSDEEVIEEISKKLE